MNVRPILLQMLLLAALLLTTVSVYAQDSSGVVCVARQPVGGSVESITPVQNKLYVAIHHGGVSVFSIDDSAHITQSSHLSITGAGFHISFDGQYVYLTDDSLGFRILSVANVDSPQVIASFPDSGGVRDLCSLDNYVYAAAGNDLIIVDVSQPTQPLQVGTYHSASPVNGVAIFGNTVYLANDTAGVTIVDVTHKTAPRLITTFPIANEEQRKISVQGTIAFVTGTGIREIDVSDTTAVHVIDSYRTDATVEETFVFCCGGYLAEGENGFHEVDFIANPIADLTHYRDNVAKHCVTFTGEYIVVGSDGGLELYEYEQDGITTPNANTKLPNTLTLSNYPNPFNATTTIRFSLPQTGIAKIDIFDATGRVMTKFAKVTQAGTNQIQFDGNRFPSGEYFVRVRQGSQSVVRKMVLLK